MKRSCLFLSISKSPRESSLFPEFLRVSASPRESVVVGFLEVRTFSKANPPTPMTMLTRSLVLATITAIPAFAQTPASSPVADVRTLWKQTQDYIVEAAKDVPESMYSYKPAPDVRTFGQLIGHIAGSQYMFCAIAFGAEASRGRRRRKSGADESRPSSPHSRRRTKPAQRPISKLKRRSAKWSTSSAHNARGSTRWSKTRRTTTSTTATIVTYLRMNKMVPPSSKPRAP